VQEVRDLHEFGIGVFGGRQTTVLALTFNVALANRQWDRVLLEGRRRWPSVCPVLVS